MCSSDLPANANFIADYAARALAFGLEAIDDERVRGFLERSLSAQLRRLDVSTFLARLLEILTANRRHHALLDQTIAALHELLSREETREFLGEKAREGRDKAVDVAAQAAARGREVVAQSRETLANAIERGREAYNQARETL